MIKNVRTPLSVKPNQSEQDQLIASLTALQIAIEGLTQSATQDTATPAAVPITQQNAFTAFTRTIAAGDVYTENFVGNFFFLLSNSNSNSTTKFNVSFNNQSTCSCPPGFVFGAPFTQVNFQNTDSAPATVIYFLGNGKIDYKALVLSGSNFVQDLITEAQTTLIATNTGVGGTLDTDLASILSSLNILNSILKGTIGTQIIMDTGSSTVTTGATLYTVPVGNNLYLSSAWVSSQAGNYNTLIVQNASSVFQYNIVICNTISATISNMTRNFPSPIVIPTGYKIIYTTSTSVSGSGGFNGWIM